MKLILISPEQNRRDEIALYQSFCDHPKLEHIHIRKKGEVPTHFWTKLYPFKDKIVRSEYLKPPFDCRGIHGSNALYSSSAHSIEEALSSQSKFTYISPVFPSISKSDYANATLLSDLKSLKSLKKNWVALGGISLNNLATIKTLGFDYAAVLGAVWLQPHPQQAFRKLLDAL